MRATMIRTGLGPTGLSKNMIDRHIKAFNSARTTLAKKGINIDTTSFKTLSTIKVGIASDHAGFNLKTRIGTVLTGLGVNIIDFGPQIEPETKLDYPVFAAVPLDLLSRGLLDKVMLACGTGMGMEIIANKYPGIRSALAANIRSVMLARQHSNINVLTFGEWTAPDNSSLYQFILIFLLERFNAKNSLNYPRRLEEIEAIAAAARRSPDKALHASLHLESVLQQTPELAQIYSISGKYLIENGKIDEGLGSLEKYARFGKKDPLRKQNLGEIATALNKLVRSKKITNPTLRTRVDLLLSCVNKELHPHTD